jgi:integrase
MATRVRLKRRQSPPKHPSPPPAGRKSIEEQLRLIRQGIYYYRDGDVVLYRRPDSQIWQVRYKMLDGTWQRQTTGHRNRVDAALTACHRYDEARFRQRHGLAPERKRFSDVATVVLTELRKDLAAGTGKKVYRDYCQAIERYLLPYFGNKHIDNIKPQDIVEFERWRNEKLGRAPAHSTLLTYAAAWQRCVDTAKTRGWLTEKQSVGRLTVQGRKGVARPGFTAAEVERLRDFMATWATATVPIKLKERELRVMLRDYVELLLLTGMRHGTEAMGLEWRHCEWYCDAGGQKYLRIRVSGKTGSRLLIAKHAAVAVLERRAANDVLCVGQTLDAVLAASLSARIWRFSTGEQPWGFLTGFKRLLTQCGLLKDTSGADRTLYSLRHTYATLELLSGTDIHTLARQMGTSVLMLERHYSKLTATLAAGKLAG